MTGATSAPRAASRTKHRIVFHDVVGEATVPDLAGVLRTDVPSAAQKVDEQLDALAEPAAAFDSLGFAETHGLDGPDIRRCAKALGNVRIELERAEHRGAVAAKRATEADARLAAALGDGDSHRADELREAAEDAHAAASRAARDLELVRDGVFAWQAKLGVATAAASIAAARRTEKEAHRVLAEQAWVHLIHAAAGLDRFRRLLGEAGRLRRSGPVVVAGRSTGSAMQGGGAIVAGPGLPFSDLSLKPQTGGESRISTAREFIQRELGVELSDPAEIIRTERAGR